MNSYFIPGDHLLQRQARAGPGEEGADSGGQRGAGRHQADGPAVPQRKTDGMVQFSGVVVANNKLHYTPVLPVLLLRGGRDISQGNFIKRGTLGQKVGDIEKQYYQCPTFFAKSGGH